MTETMLRSIIFNASGTVRTDFIDGVEYWVAPMVMGVEGVLNGSQGPLFYPEDEWSKNPSLWDCKPIVVNHPEIDGQFVSACSPEMLSKQQVGMILNTTWDGRLSAEAWIDKKKVAKVSEKVKNALENCEKMEVSTGLFTENEAKSGVFKGKKYTGIARNLVPDHLAILPDEVGACSNADGAGLMVNKERLFCANKLSFSAIRSKLYDALREKYRKPMSVTSPLMSPDWYGYIEDVYDDFLVFCTSSDQLYKIGYKVSSKDAVTLVGKEVPVDRIISYKETKTPSVNGEKTMTKAERVTKIIAANAGWGEEDREFLMELPDTRFHSVEKGALGFQPQVDEKSVQQQQATSPVQQPVVQPVQQQAAPQQVANQQMTLAQYIQNAPPEIREVLTANMNSHNKLKADLVNQIVANKRNSFTKEYLMTLNADVLQGLAALAANEETQQQQQRPMSIFLGNAGSSDPALTGNSQTEEDDLLPLPQMTWDK